MSADNARGVYLSSYLSSKVLNETEYEMRLRVIKEKHEERLEALTDKIRVIYEEIRRDQVLSTMRSDPTSSLFVSKRMKEICEDHLAQEREQTIERLTEDVAYSQTELKKIDKEAKELRMALDAAHEGFARFQNCEQENKFLRGKVQSITREFEDYVKKNSECNKDYGRRVNGDSEKLKENLEMAERNLRQKNAENERLAQDLERFKEKVAELMQEVDHLNLELREREKISRDSLDVINGLKEELMLARREKEDIKSRNSNYGQQFKDIIENEEKSHKDVISELNTTYKEKSHRFKCKIIEQKKIINSLESDLSIAREIAETAKQSQDRSVLTAQEDLKKVKDQWERRCKDIEKENTIQIAEMQSKHQMQIAELQRHFQELLEERIKDFQLDQSSNLSRQKALDLELKKMMDEKIVKIEKEYIQISRHESVLNEELSKLRIKHLQEIREIEDTYSKEIAGRVKEVKDLNSFENEKLVQRVSSLESERTELISAKRSLESEIAFCNEKAEKLTVRVAELKKEIADQEAEKKELKKIIEENSSNALGIKNLLEEEATKRKQLEIEIEKEKEKANILQSTLREAEKDFTFKQQNSSISFQEQTAGYEEALVKEQQKAKRILNELEHFQELCKKLEAEIDDLKENHSRDVQDFFSSSQRIKQEEYSKYEREVESHLETKRQLIQAEHKAKFLNSELEANEKLGNELRMLTSKYEKEISELRRSLSTLEYSLSQSEKVSIKLKKELESSKEEESSVRIINKQALKESLDRL